MGGESLGVGNDSRGYRNGAPLVTSPAAAAAAGRDDMEDGTNTGWRTEKLYPTLLSIEDGGADLIMGEDVGRVVV